MVQFCDRLREEVTLRTVALFPCLTNPYEQQQHLQLLYRDLCINTPTHVHTLRKHKVETLNILLFQILFGISCSCSLFSCQGLLYLSLQNKKLFCFQFSSKLDTRRVMTSSFFDAVTNLLLSNSKFTFPLSYQSFLFNLKLSSKLQTPDFEA